MLTLDVGCGDHPRGTVNLDYRKGGVNPEIEQVRDVFVDVQVIPNFIQADAQHLPFRDKSFDKVLCYHVIEHVPDPYMLVRELLRVSKKIVEIRCPHRFSCHAKMPYHRHYFTRAWFGRVFNDYKIDVVTTHWFPIPFFALLRLPHEIRVKVLKHRKKLGCKN